MMDENAMAKAPRSALRHLWLFAECSHPSNRLPSRPDIPRPGTSLRRPTTGAPGTSGGSRPLTTSGRPITGFLRPGTSNRLGTAQRSFEVSDAYLGSARPGTSSARPTSVAGRYVRLGTQAGLSEGDRFINPDRLACGAVLCRPIPLIFCN